ncbi:MAG: formate/nitrite transporter family protein [Geminicoccaceae bacterium]
MAIADSLGIDAYKPAQIALRVEEAGVAKAKLGTVQLTVLGILAGAFIGFGAMLFTLVMTDHGLGFGPARLLGGSVFALGLILVVIAGAELFTGNNLIVMARIDGKVSTADLVRNWVVVFLANFAGAFAAAILMALSGTLAMNGGAVMETAAAIARGKVALSMDEAFFRAILCNALVCLAVWLSFAARDVAGKILAIVPPVAAFVALGFEHSIANIYFIGLALVTGVEGVGVGGFLANLAVVTVGNVIGGGGLVGLAYWFCYRLGAKEG